MANLNSVPYVCAKPRIKEYEIVDHGIHDSQEFRGCCSGDFDFVATGIGIDFAEALDDAIENLADTYYVGGFLERIIKDEGKIPKSRKAKGENWYFVSIKVS